MRDVKEIYRGYADIETIATATQVKCPYCGEEWLEEDSDECGKTYTIECEECGEEFKMHFDAS